MAAAKASKEDVFDEDRLCRLIEMMKEHDLSEVDLQEDTQRIRLRRATAPVVGAAPVYAAPAPLTAPAAAAIPVRIHEAVSWCETGWPRALP